MSLRENTKAQSTIEFTFAMIAVIFLMYGMVMVFRWTGIDLAQRRWAQDNSIMQNVGNPALQLSTDLDNGAQPMAAVYHGSITYGNTNQ